MFLDEEKQSLFGLEVVVESGQRHTARARKIPHGSAFIAFFAKDIRGVDEYFCQSLVISRFGRHAWRRSGTIPRGNACCGGRTTHNLQPALFERSLESQYSAGRLGPQELNTFSSTWRFWAI